MSLINSGSDRWRASPSGHVLNDTQITGVAGGGLMAADPKEELSEGLKHCLWFRGPLLMDHLMTLRHEVNQLNAPPRPATNRVDVEDSSNP